MDVPERTLEASGRYAQAAREVAQEAELPVVDLWTKLQVRCCMDGLLLHQRRTWCMDRAALASDTLHCKPWQGMRGLHRNVLRRAASGGLVD